MSQSELRRMMGLVIILLSCNSVSAQDFNETFSEFQKQLMVDYQSFRDKCNHIYADFLRSSWNWYKGKAPIPMPKEETPIPPRHYELEGQSQPIYVYPTDVEPIKVIPQPKPVEPIREIPSPDINYFTFAFYGIDTKIRMPEYGRLSFTDCTPNNIASLWESLCSDDMNNAIRDCIEIRIQYNLCDWAYLQFLNQLAQKYCKDPNGATLLTAFLYCQSGYQMRLAIDGSKLMLLYGSRHQIFDKGYFNVDGVSFYPLGEPSNTISICGAAFEGETPMSLIIDKEQLLGTDMSRERTITAEYNNDMSVVCQVPHNLMEFYNTYPTSSIDSNPLTRWAMYANTPLAHATKEKLYTPLRKSIAGCNKLQATEKLLNWVQTGFVYEYDDKVWGHDRAFFAEETLYYPYCDCEDRSILFSRLIRDLLGLDVALIYYPGHLATAVCFDHEVPGDAMIIEGRKFIVCDPTYIGAPVGAQMPDLEYDKAKAIILKK